MLHTTSSSGFVLGHCGALPDAHAASMMRPMSLADRVKAARKALKWSQQRLADEAGLAIDTVRKIEQGASQGRDSIPALARALQMTASRLQYGDETRSESRVDSADADDIPTSPPRTRRSSARSNLPRWPATGSPTGARSSRTTTPKWLGRRSGGGRLFRRGCQRGRGRCRGRGSSGRLSRHVRQRQISRAFPPQWLGSSANSQMISSAAPAGGGWLLGGMPRRAVPGTNSCGRLDVSD